MGKSRTYTNEDTTVIVQATNDALDKYNSQPVSVSSVIMEYGGSKSALARELAGIGPGKLPAKGTAERKAYEAANKSIGRWLAAESGSGKQSRKPSKESQERLKNVQKNRTPSTMSIHIEGWIGYDDDFRHRTIDVQLPNNGATVGDFLDNMKNGNTEAAYQDVFQAYKVGRGILTVADDNPQVIITLS